MWTSTQGNVLRIDLSAGTAEVEPLNMEWARLYVGGKGLMLRYLWELTEAGMDPWSPENPLIVAPGPFAGTNVSTCSRVVLGGKSPANGTILDSYCGGSFGSIAQVRRLRHAHRPGLRGRAHGRADQRRRGRASCRPPSTQAC